MRDVVVIRLLSRRSMTIIFFNVHFSRFLRQKEVHSDQNDELFKTICTDADDFGAQVVTLEE